MNMPICSCQALLVSVPACADRQWKGSLGGDAVGVAAAVSGIAFFAFGFILYFLASVMVSQHTARLRTTPTHSGLCASIRSSCVLSSM